MVLENSMVQKLIGDRDDYHVEVELKMELYIVLNVLKVACCIAQMKLGFGFRNHCY